MANNGVRRRDAARDTVLVDLALQGGGSHGAFTWGVLDRLLEEPWLKIEAISGHLRRRDERRGAGQRAHAGRRRGRAGGARRLLGSGGGSGEVQPDPALAARPVDEPLVARHVPGLSRDGYDVAGGIALQPQPVRSQPDQQDPQRQHRLRASRRGDDQALHHRDQCAYRARTRVPQRGDHPGRAPGLRLPADDVPGGRNRRRAVLGRRVRRQPDHYAARSRKRRARRHPGPDQPPGTPRNAAHGE